MQMDLKFTTRWKSYQVRTTLGTITKVLDFGGGNWVIDVRDEDSRLSRKEFLAGALSPVKSPNRGEMIVSFFISGLPQSIAGFIGYKFCGKEYLKSERAIQEELDNYLQSKQGLRATGTFQKTRIRTGY